MIYLETFSLPDIAKQEYVLNNMRHVESNVYPFRLFEDDLPTLEFAPVTILYGGNGSGKTTILNLIAQRLDLARSGPYNKTAYFDIFKELCEPQLAGESDGFPIPLPADSRYISSDDVFSHILKIRRDNEERDLRFNEEARNWRQDIRKVRLDTWKQGGVEKFLNHRQALRQHPGSYARSRGVSERVREYSNGCEPQLAGESDGFPIPLPADSRYISSDDVFSHILKIRRDNEERDLRFNEEARNWRQDIRKVRLDTWKQGGVEKFLNHRQALRQHPGSYARSRGVSERVREYSNGENAFLYFTEAIGETGLYLLDEPENSLSPALQIQLAEFLQASLELRTQFIIATHSPLLLGLPGAKVYDLSASPVCTRPWQQLENVRLLHDFFMLHRSDFEERGHE